MSHKRTIEDILNNFEIWLVGEELLSRGVQLDIVKKFVTSNAVSIDNYLKQRKWSINAFYDALIIRQKAHGQKKSDARIEPLMESRLLSLSQLIKKKKQKTATRLIDDEDDSANEEEQERELINALSSARVHFEQPHSTEKETLLKKKMSGLRKKLFRP
jgi:hypothetical protein